MVTMYFDRNEERRAMGLDTERHEEGERRRTALTAAKLDDERQGDKTYRTLRTVFAVSFIARTRSSIGRKRKAYQGKAAQILVECLDLDRHCPVVQLRKGTEQGEPRLSVWALHRLNGWVQIYPLQTA